MPSKHWMINMRIAILTFHRAYNCGAMLQAWALKTVLERMGHSIEFPILNHVGERTRWPSTWVKWSANPLRLLRSFIYRSLYNFCSIPCEDIRRFRFKRFRKRYLPERACTCEELAKYYDLIVIGSDQVWSDVHSLDEAPIFFAENLPASIPKIGYAVSYGDKPLPTERLSRVVAAYQRFKAVSVREQLVQQQLEECGCGKPSVTLDPTLLLEKDDYLQIITGARPLKEPYLFMYTLSTQGFFVDTAKAIAKRLGVRAIIAPMYQRTRYGAVSGLTYGISPDKLVEFVAHAKYVLAGSFHGTVLATIFGKPMLSLRMEADNPDYPSRPGGLLKLVGQEKRLVTPDVSIDDMIVRLTAPIPSTNKLLQAKETSITWLKRNLE